MTLGAFFTFKIAPKQRRKGLHTRATLISSTRGFLLLESLLATAIITLVGYFALSLNNYFNKSLTLESSKVVQNMENAEFVKRISAPIYFGSLAKYEDNLQLKKCLTVDENTCETNQKYSFRAFDLTTDQPMNFASKDSQGIVKTETFFKVHCANEQTTCDKAEYFTVIAKTYVYNDQGEQVSFVEKSDIVAPQFSNVYTYVPSTELSPGRPINVIIYLDNSGSMLAVKDKIKTALDNLLDKLSGLDVRVGLYTLYNASMYNVYVTQDEYYLDASNQKQSVPNPIPDDFEWYELRAYKADYLKLFMGSQGFTHSNVAYDFKSTDSTEIRTDKKNYIKQIADYYFSISWDTSPDMPFCSILRMLETPSANPLFRYDSFTPNIIYIITNEDDETAINRTSGGATGGCPHSELWKPQKRTSTGNYQYNIDVQTLNLDINANFTVDDALLNQNYKFNLNIDKYQSSAVYGADCKAYAESIGEYVENALSAHKSSYTKGSGYTINSCTFSLGGWVTGTSTTQVAGYCDQINNGLRPTPFPEREPDLLPSYRPNSCRENYYPPRVVSSASLEKVYPLATIEGVSNLDTATLVYESFKRNTDINNIYFVPIIHPDDTSCGSLTDGARVGTKYLQLAAKPGMNSTVIPVCSPDFSGPLDSIVSWTSSMGINDLEISSFVAANFGSVELIRNGSALQLTMEVDYSLIGTTILFKPGTVLANDTIKVYTK